MRIDAATALCLCLSILPALSPAAAADKDGTADHPLLSRYEGFVIRDQAVIEYDDADIILGPLVEVDREKSLALRRLEGTVHNTQYRLDDTNVSVLQLYRNYESALLRLNADMLFSCFRDECFDIRPDGTGIFLNNFLNNNGRVFSGLNHQIRGDIGILTARLVDGPDLYYITLVMNADNANDRRSVHQTIIRSAALDMDKIAIGSAEEIARLILASGKAVLDGIYFDHDTATIRPESEATLEAIAEYLMDIRGQSFFVVGHTDGTGSYAYNLDLSEQRAQAVIDALESLGVDTTQLRAVGIGPVAPADSNRDEAGLANNRRVELVEDFGSAN